LGLDEGGAARIAVQRDDHIVDYFPQKDRRFVRYMPQDPNEALFPRLSVGDNNRVLAQLLNIPPTFAENIREIVGDETRALADGLSGGEKKLLLLEAILCSLHTPAVPVFVLLDEPFAGLYPPKTEWFLNKLNVSAKTYINDSAVTFLIVDHDHVSLRHGEKAEIGDEMIVSHLDSLTFRREHES
jgi:ABC-type multidrug transport system ATPase subunit